VKDALEESEHKSKSAGTTQTIHTPHNQGKIVKSHHAYVDKKCSLEFSKYCLTKWGLSRADWHRRGAIVCAGVAANALSVVEAGNDVDEKADVDCRPVEEDETE
jgi:hypothetical protein